MVIPYFGRAIAWNRDLVYEDRTDASQDQLGSPNGHDIQHPVFTVKVTKNSANRIMAHYLKSYLKDSKIKYAVTLGTNEAALSGSFKFLGNAVKFQLTFDPLVLKNGDVLLKAKNLNIGALPVPISFVMSYIGNSYKIPKWVSLDSKAGTVVLKLSQFKLQNGMTLKANKLDLTNDDLEFAVYLPDEE